MATSPIRSLADANADLARLKSDQTMSAAELDATRQSVEIALGRNLTIKREVLRSIGRRNSWARSFLNYGAWALGILGCGTGIGDHVFFDLSLWGLVGYFVGAA